MSPNISSVPICLQGETLEPFSLLLAGEPRRPVLLQVPKFAVTFLLELRLLLDGDDVDGGVRGHRLRHRRRSWVPSSLPPGWPGE